MADKSFTYYVAEDIEGRFAAFSTHEPVFCYICETEEEAVRKADDTFRSFLRLFPSNGHRVAPSVATPVRQMRPRTVRHFELACAV